MGGAGAGWGEGVVEGCPAARGADGRAGRCSPRACGQSSLSSAVLMTQRLNLERDINTAAAEQTLPGTAALTQGPLLLASRPGSAGPSGAPGQAAAVAHRQRLVRRHLRKT